jgi:hypothetical protein
MGWTSYRSYSARNAAGWLILLAVPLSVFGEESSPVRVVKTSPAYGETVQNLSGFTATIRFNKEMDPKMQEDFLLDQRGAMDEMGNPIEIPGDFDWTDPMTLQFKAKTPLKPNAVYQISLFSARTKDGEEMEEVPFRLVFKTGRGE